MAYPIKISPTQGEAFHANDNIGVRLETGGAIYVCTSRAEYPFESVLEAKAFIDEIAPVACNPIELRGYHKNYYGGAE